MAISRKQKEEMFEKVKGIVADNETVAFVNFHGLGVSDTTEMRKLLKESGVGYTVVKKTIAKRALEEAGVPGEVPELEGELALAYGEETAPAREVFNFGKKHEGTLSILGGIFEGKIIAQDAMVEIATIPSLDVLRGMFVNLINSPIQRFAIALDQIAQQKA